LIDAEGYTELFERDSASEQKSFTQELQLQGDAFNNSVS